MKNPLGFSEGSVKVITSMLKKSASNLAKMEITGCILLIFASGLSVT